MENFEMLLGKGNHMLKSIQSRGFTIPTEIQEKSIPAILEKKDVIVGSVTGSGKTLAFAAGLINNVKKGFGIQGLVLTPTRELAEQLTNELENFSRAKDLEIVSVYGGVSLYNQVINLAQADIVVGTPGRILDHISRNSINFSNINTLVLDEADRMLDMGFREDVEKIIRKCPEKRQTLLFSATISGDVVYLMKRYMDNPIEISTEQCVVDESKLKQVYYDVENNLKYSLLKYLLENEKANLAMIFCNTRLNVDFVANNLSFAGIKALPIHGGFPQEKRNKMLEKFHSKEVRILVCTDVAARGLDIKGVSHIYNYDIPKTKKEYIHRIGRTARAGKDGKVINLLSSRDYDNFRNLMTDEFEISMEKTPFIERVPIRWMPERKHARRGFGRKPFGHNFGARNNNRRDFRHNSRSRSNGRRDWKRSSRRY